MVAVISKCVEHRSNCAAENIGIIIILESEIKLMQYVTDKLMKSYD
jgi:hypothetical protein